MKRIILLTIAMVTTMVFSSCGGKHKPIEKMIAAENIDIIGTDANTMSIAGDAKLFMVQIDDEKDDDKWTMKALLTLKNNERIKTKRFYTVEFDINDANYTLVHEDLKMEVQDEEVLISLFDNNIGTTKNVVFEPKYTTYACFGYEKLAELIKKATNLTIKLEIDSPYEDDPNEKSIRYSTSSANSSLSTNYTASNTGYSSSSSYAKSSGNANWDTFLDNYEEMVNKYIEFYKKAMKGDMSAMTTYTEYMEKITTLAEQLDAAEDDMTTAQLNRYMKITAKLTEAAAEAANETSTYDAGW